MNYSKIEKQAKIIEEIKAFDLIILKIEQMCNKIEHDKASIKISMSVEVPKKENILDGDSVITPNILRSSYL